MDELIEALTIFRKYGNPNYPTQCEHDVLYVVGIGKDGISTEDILRLESLGFFWSESEGCFVSFRFGSA
jgi:hypothetical protein